jgi:hypothetical protein
MPVSNPLTAEIAATTARIVVEEGLEWAPPSAAPCANGLPARTPLPDNDQVEDAVREYLDIFCRHPAARAARPAPAGAGVDGAHGRVSPAPGSVAWHATRLSDIYIQLFCDDPKSAEIALIDHHVTTSRAR